MSITIKKEVYNIDDPAQKSIFLDYKSFIFPAGEIGIKLDANNFAVRYNKNPYIITARLQNSVDVFSLGLIKDAIERYDVIYKSKIQLTLPYVPYARQDRVCAPGESFSLKVFANYINSLKFDSVTVYDPHSDVTGAVFNNLVVKTQFNIIDSWLKLTNRIINTRLVSPDSGSNKKTSEIATYLGHDNFIRADKLRNLNTGEIKETIVYCEDLKGADVSIIDDIADGAKSFTELAKVLKKKGAGKIILYVTHGIFSKGTDYVFENGVDEIWTTDSFRTDLVETEKLHILKI